MPRTLTHQQPPLVATRTGRWVAFAMGLLTIGAIFTPLAQVPGYELAELLTLFNALAAGPLAVAGMPRGETALPVRAALRAGAWLLLLNALATLAVIVRAAVGSHCSPFAGLPFVALLPFPTALLAPCLAAGIMTSVRRSAPALVLYYLGIAALLVHGAWPAYAHPQAFGYDHVLGYVPGLIYDEDLQAPRALWLFRCLSLGLIGLSFLSLAIAPALTPLVFVGVILATGPLEHRIGTRTSVADLDRALGATREFRGLTLHAPRELPAQRLDELLRAVAIARGQVAAALGTNPSARVDVFLFRSPEEKAAITGAGASHFTKPWLGQIFTQVDTPEVVRHEMVHALAAEIGGGPFGVGEPLLFNIGVIEGLAEAIDWPADAYTLDEWSAGMKAAGLFEPPKKLLPNLFTFFAAPQGQAYTVAGAFIHWLLETHGKKAVQDLYRTGNFQRSTGSLLPALSDEFEAALDRIVVSPQLKHAANERFRARALFARPCGREVAELRDEAQVLDAQGDHLGAARLFGRCATIDPGEPQYLEAHWRALRAAHDPEADRALVELLASPATDDAMRARVSVTQGSQDFAEGQPEEAKLAFEDAQKLGLPPSMSRAVEIRLLSLPFPDLAEPLHRALDDSRDDLALLSLAEAANEHPLFAPLPYLLGLRLAARGEWSWAVRELSGALDLGLPDDLAAQALRISLSSALKEQHVEEAALALAALRALPRPPAEQRQTEDLAQQLQLEQDLFGGAQ